MKMPKTADLQPRFVPELDHALVLLLRSAHVYRLTNRDDANTAITEILAALDELCSWVLLLSALMDLHHDRRPHRPQPDQTS